MMIADIRRAALIARRARAGRTGIGVNGLPDSRDEVSTILTPKRAAMGEIRTHPLPDFASFHAGNSKIVNSPRPGVGSQSLTAASGISARTRPPGRSACAW
jgi:hypothetical protein